MILTSDFFSQPTLEIAPKLLGKFLLRKYKGRVLSGMVTEVEAYIGMKDKACHAAKGKTQRNKVMFKEGGVWYVYLCYGMYWMLNIVTEKKDFPSAILIRGIRTENKNLNGPGKLTAGLHIDKKFNEREAIPKYGLWFEDEGIKIDSQNIQCGKRIGISYAGEWQHKLWRFFI